MRSLCLVVSLFVVGRILVVAPALADDGAAKPATDSPTSIASDEPAQPGIPPDQKEAGRTKAPAPAQPAIPHDEGEAGRTKEAPRATAGNEDDEKLGVGVDAVLTAPVGEFSEDTGPIVGGTLRLGYDVSPRVQAYVRGGYQYGLKAETEVMHFRLSGETETLSVTRWASVIPVYFGARYFLMRPRAGLYGSVEVGMNLLRQYSSLGGRGDSEARIGINAGVGYVLTKDLPLNIGVQIAHLNLLGADSNETALIGVGAQLGYEMRF